MFLSFNHTINLDYIKLRTKILLAPRSAAMEYHVMDGETVPVMQQQKTVKQSVTTLRMQMIKPDPDVMA